MTIQKALDQLVALGHVVERRAHEAWWRPVFQD
jgi:hypothetical protein